MSLAVRATGDNLCLEVKLNNQTKFNQVLSTNTESISFDFDDSDNAANVLEIVMSGKLPEHTVLDNSGSIIADRLIEINAVTIDDIELGQLFLDKTVYTHDFNGSAAETQDRFFGTMGCNGTLRWEFTGPVYQWLLENL